MAGFSRFSGSELTLLTAAAASAIADGLDNSDVNILSNMFSAIGDNLAIIASSNEAAISEAEAAAAAATADTSQAGTGDTATTT